MTVKITKPALNLREELNSLKKPAGLSALLEKIGAVSNRIQVSSDMTVAGTATFTDSIEMAYSGGLNTFNLLSNNTGSGTLNILSNAQTAGTDKYINIGKNTGSAAGTATFITMGDDSDDSFTKVIGEFQVTGQVSASGNFLMGNTVANPASGFTTQRGFGYEASTGKTEIATTADAPAMHIGKNHVNDGDIVVFRKRSLAIGSIGTNGSTLYIGSTEGADAHLGFGNQIIRPVTSSGASRDNAIDLGYIGMRFRDLYLSGGVIAGPATATNISYASNFSAANGDIQLTLERTTSADGWGGIGGNSANAFHVYNSSIQKVLQVSQTDGSIQFPQSTSAGIYLGGTAAANKLDDYEEGDYDCTITCSTSGTVTLDSSYHRVGYTKVGRLVTVHGFIVVSSVSSPVGYFKISLPFTPINLTNRAGDSAATLVAQNVASANVADFMGTVNEGGAEIIVQLGDSTAIQNDSAQQLQANTYISFSTTYSAA
jgi:hypothetical protein